MSDFTFIVNPAAGKGKVSSIVRKLEQLLTSSRLKCDVAVTDTPGHATELARNAPGPYVVAVGGDGTINEVANGIVDSDKSLGIIPGGSGNDFIKSVGIPKNTEAAFARLLKPNLRRVDVGTVRCGTNETTSPVQTDLRSFFNGIGIGFDAAVASRTHEIRWLTGTLLYLVAVFQTLRRYTAPTFAAQFDDEKWIKKHLLVAIGNGRCAGGGFFLTPSAKVDDGTLDVTAIEDIPIRTILRLMPQVMRGKRVEHGAVRYLRAKEIHMSSDIPFMVHADGEIVGRDVSAVTVGVRAGALSLLV